MNQPLSLRATNTNDAPWIKAMAEKDWGGEPLVIRGKKHYPSSSSGIVAEENQKIVGVLFFEIQNQDCEILLLEAYEKFKGIGTVLVNEVKSIAKNKNCKRVYLMTTNDNLDALRFYQKRGFTICGIHIDSVKNSRAIKPSIGMFGDHGIPLRDEIDLEISI